MMVVLILLSHTVVAISAAPWYFLPLNISTFMGWIEVATKAVVLETTLFNNHRYAQDISFLKHLLKNSDSGLSRPDGAK